MTTPAYFAGYQFGLDGTIADVRADVRSYTDRQCDDFFHGFMIGARERKEMEIKDALKREGAMKCFVCGVEMDTAAKNSPKSHAARVTSSGLAVVCSEKCAEDERFNDGSTAFLTQASSPQTPAVQTRTTRRH